MKGLTLLCAMLKNDFSLNLFNVDINVQCSFQEKLIQTTKSLKTILKNRKLFTPQSF